MTRADAVWQTDAFVDAALAEYALTNAAVSFLTLSFNTIYRVSAAEGEFTLRVSPEERIHAPHVTDAEEAWTDQIGKAGLVAPRILRTVDGRVEVAEPGPAGRRAVLLTWVDGTALERPLTPEQIVSLGELSAQAHLASPPTDIRPPGVLDARSPILFEVPDLLSRAPEAHRELFRTRAAQAQEYLTELWATADEAPRVLHFDLTPNNVLRLADGRLSVIDCQDLAWGHRAQDIAHTIYGITRGELDERATARFRAGYERHATWPELDSGRLRRLFVARRIGMINLALTLRRPGLAAYLDRHAAALR